MTKEICEKEKAIVYCPEKGCNQTYCEKCFDFTHQSTKNQKHQGIPANRKTEYQCKQHKKIYQSICLKCKEFSCFLCCLKDGKHFSHDIVLIEDSKTIVDDIVRNLFMKGANILNQTDKELYTIKSQKHTLLKKLEFIENRKKMIEKFLETSYKLSNPYDGIKIQYYFKEIKESVDSIDKFECDPFQELKIQHLDLDFNKSQPNSKRGSWILHSKQKLDEKRKSIGIQNLGKGDNWIEHEMKQIFNEYMTIISENDPSLTEVLLNSCKLDDDNVITLSDAMLKNTHVIKIDLSGNENIKGKCGDSICKLLEENKILTE